MVNKDVQSMLLPLNLMQYIMFCPKYRIKENVITPNSFFSKFISMIVTLILILIFMYRVFFVLSHKDSIITVLIVTSIYDCIYYCFGFIMNFLIGLIHTKKSIKFVLIFQKVHRFLYNESSFNRVIIGNWVMVIMALAYNVILYTYFCVKLHRTLMYTGYFLIFFDFNVIYASRVFKMLEDKLVLWNRRLLNSQKVINMHRRRHSMEMFQTYVGILECYYICNVCFQHFVSTLICFCLNSND